MTLLLRSGSAFLFLLSLVLLPIVSMAQVNTVPNPGTSDFSDPDSLTKDELLFRNNESSPVSNMPVYNPKTNADILIYQPPENIVYHMPILGSKDSSHLRPETFNPDSLDVFYR